MAETNNKWTMWLAGIIVTIVVIIILPAMARGIVVNDRIRASEDTRIEAKYDGKIDKVVDIVTGIRLEQRELITIIKRRD